MNAAAPGTATPHATPPSRAWRWLRAGLVGLLVLLLLLVLGIRHVLKPEVATRLILQQAGNALGLEITADGKPELRLRGTPQLVVRGVHARQPGARREVLRAERILLALPWDTLKSRGRKLDIQRAELDAPVLDLAALAAWQGSRPAGSTPRLPTLTRGLKVTRGELLGSDWRVQAIEIELAYFAPQRPLAAHVAGTYVAPAMRLPFDLQLVLSKPANTAALGLAGEITPTTRDWQLPMRIRLSAPMRFDDQGLRLLAATLGANARYQARDEPPIPFAFGMHGPARISHDGLDWPQLALALRGRGIVPRLDAQGSLHAGADLRLALAGRMPAWPAAWPQLPKPLSESRAPLAFALDYRGAFDFSDVLALQLRRDATRFDGRLHLRDVLAWRDAGEAGSPLPPIDGNLSTPRLEISGAVLEGVEIDLEEASVPPAESPPAKPSP